MRNISKGFMSETKVLLELMMHRDGAQHLNGVVISVKYI